MRDLKLDILLEYAPKLRAAGVLHVTVDGITANLAPAEAEGEPEQEVAVNSFITEGDLEDDPDPMHDPISFGRGDGRVPGYDMSRIRKREEG